MAPPSISYNLLLPFPVLIQRMKLQIKTKTEKKNPLKVPKKMQYGEEYLTNYVQNLQTVNYESLRN